MGSKTIHEILIFIVFNSTNLLFILIFWLQNEKGIEFHTNKYLNLHQVILDVLRWSIIPNPINKLICCAMMWFVKSTKPTKLFKMWFCDKSNHNSSRNVLNHALNNINETRICATIYPKVFWPVSRNFKFYFY
jgi:hypothetical protein